MFYYVCFLYWLKICMFSLNYLFYFLLFFSYHFTFKNSTYSQNPEGISHSMLCELMFISDLGTGNYSLFEEQSEIIQLKF